ncbi:MAG: polymer-forming cytoskeletal protein [Ginsengibacter sp.]
MANFFSQLRLPAAFLIIRNVVVHGSLNASGNTCIDSVVEGDVIIKGTLVIGKNGNIKGNVQTTNVSVHGTIDGNLTCFNKAVIGNKAYITGNISSIIIEIQEGAVIKGTVIKKTEQSIVEERMNDVMKKKEELLKVHNNFEIIRGINDTNTESSSSLEDKSPSSWF